MTIFTGCFPLAAVEADEGLAPAAASRAPPRPDHDGPYAATGFSYEYFQASFKTYALKMKLWYPARSSGENATADASGAPYPLILQLPPMGGSEENYNFVAARIVSWGFLFVTLGQNWNNDADCLNVSVVREVLARLENDNSTSGHRYHGLLESNNFGISGWSRGGAWALIDGAFIPGIRAVQGLVPAIGQSTADQLVGQFNKPLQIQIGELDSTYRGMGAYAYNVLPAPKALLDVKNGGHSGPFQWDDYISFFQRYLRNDSTYEHYLYEWGAMDSAANLTYYLNFTKPDGTAFPPGLRAWSDLLDPAEDQLVNFSGSFSGYLPAGHPRGNFRWDFTQDGQPEDGGPDRLESSWAFKKSGSIQVRMWYELGLLRIAMNNSLVETVRNLSPSARAGEDLSVEEDFRVNFTGAGDDTPSDRASLRFSWSFGDGATAPSGASPNASHAYTRPGTFRAALTVTDGDGAAASDSLEVTVSNPVPSVRAGDNVTINKDEEAALTAEGFDTPSDRPSLRYMWSFGDNISSDWSDLPSAVHTYRRSGNFSATITVRDNDGATASARLSVTVLNTPPSVSVGRPRAQDSFDKDSEVEFSGSGTDSESDRPVLQYRWDFGDGNTSMWSAEARASHVYTRGGSYTASLRVIDSEGGESRSGVTFKVVNQPPTAGILAPRLPEVDEDDKVVFSAEGTDTESDQPWLNYSWDIDGAIHFGKDLELRFAEEGSIRYKLTVRDPEGAEASATGSLEVKNVSPKLKSSLEPESLFVNDSVSYSVRVTDTASDLPGMSVLWDFGDGETSSEPNGTHVFSRPGTFNVKVTVRDDQGAKASQSYTVRVQERPAPPLPPPDDEPTAGSNGLPVAAIAGGAAAVLSAVAAVVFLVLRRRPPAAG